MGKGIARIWGDAQNDMVLAILHPGCGDETKASSQANFGCDLYEKPDLDAQEAVINGREGRNSAVPVTKSGRALPENPTIQSNGFCDGDGDGAGGSRSTSICGCRGL